MRPWEDGIKIILQRENRLSFASYDIILSPQRRKCIVTRVLSATEYVEGETRSTAIERRSCTVEKDPAPLNQASDPWTPILTPIIGVNVNVHV